MRMFLRIFLFFGLLSSGPIASCQEGYRNISISWGHSPFPLQQGFIVSYEELLPNGDGWEYGFNWRRSNGLNLKDARIIAVFEYDGESNLQLDSKNKNHQSFTINTQYNRRFHQWKNAYLVSHFGLGLGVSHLNVTIDQEKLIFSSFQLGPYVGASYQQFLPNRLCVFFGLSIGIDWRVKLPPAYPMSLQMGLKIPI